MLDLRAAAAIVVFIAMVVFIPSANNSNFVLGYILAGSGPPHGGMPMAAKLGKGTPESPNFLHKFSSEFRVGNIRHVGVPGAPKAATGPVAGELRRSAAARGRAPRGRVTRGPGHAGPGPPGPGRGNPGRA